MELGQTYRLAGRTVEDGPAGPPWARGKDTRPAIRYTDAELGSNIVEETLRLRFREAGRWLIEPTGEWHAAANAITAFPQRLGWWSVLGRTPQCIYLPLVSHDGG